MDTDQATDAMRARANWPRWVALAAAIVVLIVLGRPIARLVPQLLDVIGGLGVWAPIAFVAVYALAVVAFVPGSILTLAAGALFGLWWGTIYTLIAAIIGSSLAFLIARHAARGMVEQRLGALPRFAAIDRAIGNAGFKIVFLLRLSPVFPFSLLNYALGVSRVRFLDYLAASVGMLPGTVLYVYYGKLAGDVAVLASGAQPVERGLETWILLGVGLLATLAVTVIVTRLARRALGEATGGEEPAR